MTLISPESGPHSPGSIEVKMLAVSQPSKMQELNDLLLTLDNFDKNVREMTGEDRSGDLGGSGATASGGTQGDDGTQVSARQTLLANLPAMEVMHQKIEGHIQAEVKQLEKLSRAVARSSDPGAAYHLNELYAKIRKLNSLLANMVEASIDVVKRLFIRIFIDKQPIFSS